MSSGASESDYTQANMKCNVSKNRYPNILPSMCSSLPSLHTYYAIMVNKNSLTIDLTGDHFRVMLRATAATGSDYINASFVDVRTS